MPMNGAAAALPLELEPPSPPVSALATTDKPTELETKIGEATAGAVLAIAYGMTAYIANGQLTDAARTVGGDSLSKLAQLRLDTFGQIDFAGIAKREGRRVLFQRHGAALQQMNLDAAGLEKAFSELVGMAVGIAEKVAHDEQVFLRARAN
jgi:hypothetical protein